MVAALLLAVAQVAMAQDFCEGNFDYDDNVDGSDASIFKTHFGRGSYENPCPLMGQHQCQKLVRQHHII